MTNDKPIRTRFAPSPTGFLHIGSARTALFNFLFARHNKGKVILRVEDTDQNRLVEGAVENLLKVMKQLGIDFDEGPTLQGSVIVEQGDYGPYTQSKRLEIYQRHAQELIDKAAAYYCFCSPARLDELRKEQIALKKPAMYDRHCRNLSKEEINQQLSEAKISGSRPVVRQAIPLSGETIIKDLVYGEVRYDHATIDDQVLLKSDGFPTYHLAVVVDDHHMAISHVIRGEEWIPSTPKHILLYQAFGWEPTQYAHIPLILNPDKSKLSKRQGDVSVEDFLKHGYLPEALVNFVAFLGWNPKTEQEFFSLTELIAQFDLAKVNKAGAVFDDNKLDWVNSHYLREKSPEQLVALCAPYWQEQGIVIEKYKPEFLAAIVSLEKDRLKKLSEITQKTEYYFKDPEYDAQLLVWKKSDAADAKDKLQRLKELFVSLPDQKFNPAELESALKEFIEQNNSDNGSVLWPLRVALTGLEKSPGPFDVTVALHMGWGKEGIIKRIDTAINKLV